jgi:hypothetical protein
VPNATYQLTGRAWAPIGTARLDPGAGSMWLASSSVSPLRMPGSSHGAFFELIVSGPGSSFGKEVAALTWRISEAPRRAEPLRVRLETSTGPLSLVTSVEPGIAEG